MKSLRPTTAPVGKHSGCVMQVAGARGFTLVELLIVIAVIAVLVTLLLPAIGGVRQRARVAEVTFEIKAIESAMVAFKTQMGGDVPGSITIPGTTGTWDARSKSIIRQFFPEFDFTVNGGADWTAPIVLNGSECLTFFLGGLRKSNTEVELIGFSKNPARPFERTSKNRIGPFFKFNAARMMDFDGDGVLEYKDPLPSQTQPYVYLAGQSGSYNTSFNDSTSPGVWWNNDSWHPTDTTQQLIQLGYYSTFLVYDTSTAATTAATDTAQERMAGSTPINPRGYQIISPGADKRYGTGGLFKADDTGSLSTEDADNITNFHSGTLGGI